MPLFLVALVVAAAPAEDSAARLKREEADLRTQLVAKCPAQRGVIQQLESAPADKRVELLGSLEACGGKLEGYFVSLGNALHLVARWPEAEGAFRKALALRVTEAAQLGLLTSLVRQEALTPPQQKDLATNLGYFRQHPCTRDDLCASLSYVAWHADDVELTKSAGERAIALGFPGWQPYFTAGTVYATGPQRARAVELLREAKKRGGPTAAIDGFLARLGADGESHHE